METKEIKLWNSFLGGEMEEGLGFYDARDFDWVPEIEANWTKIRAEVDTFVENHKDRIKPYFSKKLVTGPKVWKAFSLQFWGWRFNKNIQECPETMKLMKSIPGLVGASISMIEPHSAINPHRGDTNGVYRCHLGLHIPGKVPECGFESSGEERSWEEGKIMIFNDASLHRAWNDTDKRRTVLLFDVIRPEFARKKYQACAMVLATLGVLLVKQKSKFFAKLPKALQKATLYLFAANIWVVLRLRGM